MALYRKKELFFTYEKSAKTSDALPAIFEDILQKYTIEGIYFAKGPASFMTIKLLYIFLKSLQIALGCKLLAVDSFYFTQGRAIKSIGKLFFIKEGGQIIVQKSEQIEVQEIYIPKTLDTLAFSDDIEPLYILPAVQ